MTIRSPSAFALAVLCLASSGGLGLLIHDGEVGVHALADAVPGEDVRFRASVQDASIQSFLRSWSSYGTTVDAMRYEDVDVLVLHDEDPLDDGTWVVEGTVMDTMSIQGTPYLVVRATSVTAPLLFA